MKWKPWYGLACLALLAACSSRESAERDMPAPAADERVALTPPGAPAPPLPEKPPIDLGDVDSGVMIVGTLAPESESGNVVADYFETMRSTLAMTTITVKPPFPEQLMVQFEVTATRDFVERPVVVRLRAFRDESAALGEEHAYVVGRDGRRPPMNASGVVQRRIFAVDALAGLSETPATLLLHAQADAWLMETGTAEDLLDPRAASSPERVTLISNPVRINFEQPEEVQ